MVKDIQFNRFDINHLCSECCDNTMSNVLVKHDNNEIQGLCSECYKEFKDFGIHMKPLNRIVVNKDYTKWFKQ